MSRLQLEPERKIRVGAREEPFEEDLHVQVNNGMLNISGERHHELEDKKLHRTERYFGHFERSFKLPENVREDTIRAEQKDGMLYIHLGKTEIESAPRKLEIKVS